MKKSMTFGELKKLVMESVHGNERPIGEAKKPSDLKKFKDTSKDVENDTIVGDIYDMSGNNTVKSKTRYYSGNGDGYIMDKEGNVYDVSVDERTVDAGRFAGGGREKTCIIKRVDGEHDIEVHGDKYIMSSASSETWGTIVSDIKDGMYLEDYLAKHSKDIGWKSRNLPIVQELISKGSAEAKSHTQNKADRRQARFDAAVKVNKLSAKFDEAGNMTLDAEVSVDDADIKNRILTMLEPKVEEKVRSYFKIDDFRFLSGVKISLGFADGKNERVDQVVVDLNRGKIKAFGQNKEAAINIEYFTDKISLDKLIRKQARNAFSNSQNDAYVYNYGYTDINYSVGTFSSLLQREIKNDPTPGPMVSVGNKVMRFSEYPKGWRDKLDAWHNGKRKMNIKACSDEKLEAYYNGCRNLGYGDEADMLQDEAATRGLILTYKEKSPYWENRKVTLTLSQLKRLVNESGNGNLFGAIDALAEELGVDKENDVWEMSSNAGYDHYEPDYTFGVKLPDGEEAIYIVYEDEDSAIDGAVDDLAERFENDPPILGAAIAYFGFRCFADYINGLDEDELDELESLQEELGKEEFAEICQNNDKFGIDYRGFAQYNIDQLGVAWHVADYDSKEVELPNGMLAYRVE